MPRYVILCHATPERPSHFDFMLEAGDILRTWSLSREPVIGETIPAIAIFDHRLHYLDYEGPVSDNRGSVSQWDAGNYETVQQDDSRWEVLLSGQKINGHVVIEKTADEWTFHFQKGN